MATPQPAPGPLLHFCAGLRELKFASGAPSLGDLRRRMPSRPGASTLSELFAGKIRRAPRWELVREVVGACLEHARAGGIDVPEELGALTAWRSRHEELVRSLDGPTEQRPAGGLPGMLRMAPGNRPPRLGELGDEDLGVARRLPGTSGGYLARAHTDEEMRSMLALGGPPYPQVVAYGEDGAGKSRTAVQALRAVFPERTPVLIPRDGASLAGLASAEDPRGRDGGPAIVWMDDLTIADFERMPPHLLHRLSEWAVLAGTLSTRRCREIVESGDPVARAALREVNLVHLPLEFDDAERAAAAWYFEGGTVPRSFADALDAATPRELLLRLNIARSSEPVGACVVQAAVDCRRAGLRRGLTRPELLRLLPAYLDALGAAAATAARAEEGLRWAQEPAAGGRALLRPAPEAAGGHRWRAAEELVEAADTGPVPRFLWRELIDLATPEECLHIGYEADRRDAQVYAAAAFAKAVEDRDHRAYALLGLGRARSALGSRAAAEEALHGAADEGDAAVRGEALVRLGDLRQKHDDFVGAEEAWRAAAATGDEFHAPMAWHQLGLMRVRKQYDLSEETESFFLEAAAGGHPELAPRSWAMVATLRDSRGDVRGALEACDRAAEWDNPRVRELLRELLPALRERLAEYTVGRAPGGSEGDAEALVERAGRLRALGDVPGALAAFRDAAQCEDPGSRARALFGAARLLVAEGQTDEACEVFEEVARCGGAHAEEALFELGVLLDERGDRSGARGAWSQVMRTGTTPTVARAALNLGLLERRAGRDEAATAAFERAARAQDAHVRAKAALNLALLGADHGLDDDVVDDWYRVAVDSADPEFMPSAALALGGRLAGRGQVAEAKRLIERAVGTGDPELAVRGPLVLGMIQERADDVEGAAALYRQVIGSGHPEHSVCAHVYLGRLSLRTGRRDAARWHLRAAFDAGHPEHSPEAGMLLARMHLSDGERDEAAVLLRRLIETGRPDVVREADGLLEAAVRPAP
ncbi:tetratricopeptide repeat protein [Streptomyces abyssomicinicus]|uniref:tetratricopeptide repeat protein n=1 Tax=Streptomyces abyssomicinicus TaxID=574929 RepID=UPI00124FF31F|nr:tetratricopeptide repeat protein [Streptomyces abyssomicinicus]